MLSPLPFYIWRTTTHTVSVCKLKGGLLNLFWVGKKRLKGRGSKEIWWGYLFFIGFNTGLNIGLNICFNIGFNIGFNIRFNIGLNIGINIVFNIWSPNFNQSEA